MGKASKKIQLSDYERDKFSHLTAEKNVSMGSVFIKAVALFEALLIIYGLIFIKKDLGIYLALYGVLLAVSLCLLVFINISKRDIEKYACRVNVVSLAYCILVVVWGIAITLLDWRNNPQSIMIYLTVIMSVSSAVYLMPWSIIVLQAGAYLGMLLSSIFVSWGSFNAGFLINLSVFAVIATLISFHKYYNLLSDFKLQRTVLEKNVKLKELNEKLKKASCTDALTGVNNRWGLHFVLDDLFNECTRLKKPFSVIMFDVDDFKSVNDRFGHKAGDECLMHVAGIFKKHIDPKFVFRYGGEEFIGVLSGISAEAAVEISENIRKDIEESEFSGIKVTISGGVYSKVPDLKSTTDEFLVGADKALYDAKSLGKNMVIFNAGN